MLKSYHPTDGAYAPLAARKQPLPQGVAWTAVDETFRTDPDPVLEQVQSSTAVLHDEELKRYVYTRHDDVKAILRGTHWKMIR